MAKRQKKKKEWEMKLTAPALPPLLHQKKSIKKEVKFRKKQQIFTQKEIEKLANTRHVKLKIN